MTLQEIFRFNHRDLSTLVSSRFQPVDFTEWPVTIGSKVAWSFNYKGSIISIIREQSVQNRLVIRINSRLALEMQLAQVTKSNDPVLEEVLSVLCG